MNKCGIFIPLQTLLLTISRSLSLSAAAISMSKNISQAQESRRPRERSAAIAAPDHFPSPPSSSRGDIYLPILHSHLSENQFLPFGVAVSELVGALFPGVRAFKPPILDLIYKSFHFYSRSD